VQNQYISQAALQALFTKAPAPDMAVVNLLCNLTTDATSKTRNFVYDGRVQRMRKVTGGRNIAGIPDYKNVLTAEKFDRAIAIDKHEKAMDQVGFWNKMIAAQKLLPGPWYQQMLAAALEAGTTATANTAGGFYDSTALFANSHTAWTGDNLLAGTGVTDANVVTQHEAVIAAFMGFTDRNGEPVHLDSKNLYHLVPMARLEQFNSLFTVAQMNAAGATNTLYKRAQVIGVPFLTEANDFYSFLDNGDKPFTKFMFQEPEYIFDETHLALDSLYYSIIEAHGVIGPAHGWSIIKTVVT
jgi:hypothetical protein